MAATSSSINSDPFKLDLLKRLGGASLYDYMLMEFLERLEEDAKLKQFYEGFTGYESHKILLKLAFTKESKAVISSHPVWLRFYHQFERGMNEKHFDVMVHHFEAVLQENWVEQSTVDDAVKLLKRLRFVYESKAQEHQKQVSALKQDILTFSCRKRTPEESTTTEKSACGMLGAMTNILAIPATRRPSKDMSPIAKAA
jgi:hypothetical protein